MKLPEKVCSKCGEPKAVCLFSPSGWEAKSPVCRECIGKHNKSRRVGNPVPCDVNYSFNASLGGKI
jgi:hypothetical protein